MDSNNTSIPKFALGTTFLKVFEGYDEPFQGTIASFEDGFYHGVYEDGDEEDYTEQEMEAMIQAGQQEEPTTTTIPEQNNVLKGPFALGTKFWKLFDGYDEAFQGTIVSFEDGIYHGIYDDGDEEDYSENEMETMIKTGKPTLQKKKKKKRRQQQDVTPKASAKTTIVSSRSGRKIQQVSYDLNALDENEFTESDNSDNDSSDDDSAPDKKKSRRTPKNTASNEKTQQQQAITPPSVAKGRAIDFDAYNNFLPDDEDVTMNGIDGNQQKHGNKNGKSPVPSFQNIISVPAFPDLSLSDIHEFLDPRGLDAATNKGIVDVLVGDQVSRLGGLLVRALSSANSNMNNNKGVAVVGTRENPLTLGTACTGTNAPAFALKMVQEQMKVRLEGLLTATATYDGVPVVTGDDAIDKRTKPVTTEAVWASVPELHFSHEFSCATCENERAFLERNSQSIIYPGIHEVYGDAQSKQPPLPKVNLFVAKANFRNNFAMSRATQQLDMEKRGRSGDTFMATIEVILQKQPQFCLLEIEGDLEGSWDKMKQYVTGMIPLSDCENVNGSAKGQGKDILFSFGEASQKIVVEEVPSFCGVQCGVTVAGYMQGIEGPIHPLLWPQDKGKGDTCSLSELATANKIDKKMGTLVLDRAIAYSAKMCKLDTQNYGLPQTRERTYMFVWQPLQQPPKGLFDIDNLGDYWEAVVQHLQSPLQFSLDAFLLESDHPIVRAFRESLSGTAGNEEKQGIDIPPHYWLEYLNCQPQHVLDKLVKLQTQVARDAETRDSNFSSYCWDITNQETREVLGSITSGVVGCIAPGSEFFLSHKGRPLLGFEKLMLQGNPVHLLLGDETEAQLGDLAGNSMSLTVACAAMLAAIVSPQLREEMISFANDDVSANAKPLDTKANGNNGIATILEYLNQHAAMNSNGAELSGKFAWTGVIPSSSQMEAPHAILDRGTNGQSCDSLFAQLAKLAPLAVKSALSVYPHCINEDGTNESKCDIDEEMEAGSFELKLRDTLPASLYLTRDSVSKIADTGGDHHRVRGLDLFDFDLHRIKRDCGKWVIIYYAKDKNSVGAAVAEIRISIGEIRRGKTSDPKKLGLACEITSFMPARMEPFQYGKVLPCCRTTILYEEKDSASTKPQEISWLVRMSTVTSAIQLSGDGESPSHRIQIGVTGESLSILKQKTTALSKYEKAFGEAIARGEERRWLYAESWQNWPTSIKVRTPHAGVNKRVKGLYKRVDCGQTMNQSALWVKESTQLIGPVVPQPGVYLMLKPNSKQTGGDCAIISTSMDYNDASAVLAELDQKWQPCDALDASKQLQPVKYQPWQAVTGFECMFSK